MKLEKIQDRIGKVMVENTLHPLTKQLRHLIDALQAKKKPKFHRVANLLEEWIAKDSHRSRSMHIGPALESFYKDIKNQDE